MSVSLDNFVKISIQKHLQTSVSSTRDTAVLIASDAIADSAIYSSYTFSSANTIAADVLTGYALGTDWQPTSTKITETNATIKQYARIFFENGGIKLVVVKTLTDVLTLPRNYIVIASTNTAFTPSSLAGTATANTPFQKIVLAETKSDSAPTDKADGIVYKYVTALGTGAEMSIAAYYTKMRIYDSNASKDYNFTIETYTDPDALSSIITDDNATVTSCINNDLNCVTYLAGAYRDIGGNDSNGNDLTNLFMRIVLQQSLQDRLVNLLSTKIKYDNRGIVAVNSAIANELNRYLLNGYISTTKIWTDDSLYMNNDLIIAQNTPLTNGYIIYIAPFSTLTTAELAAHTFPNIYIVYADAYSIRKIVVSGEAF
jgi:hypothetical protein